MEFSHKIIVSEDTKEEALKRLNARLTELNLNYDVKEKKVKFTELTVTVKLDTKKALERLFEVVKAPKEEIKNLIKIPSIIEATVKDIIGFIFNDIRK